MWKEVTAAYFKELSHNLPGALRKPIKTSVKIATPGAKDLLNTKHTY
jgi:hypothetical protein